jgi:hypothetical protein
MQAEQFLPFRLSGSRLWWHQATGVSASKSAQLAFGHKPKETRMNAMEHDYAIREKASQMGGALWSLAIAAIVGLMLWKSGSAIPWWVYPILFIPPVVGFARILSDEPMTVAVDSRDHRPIEEDADEDLVSAFPLSNNLS